MAVRAPQVGVLLDNLAMQRVCSKVGFELRHVPEDGVVQALLLLEPAPTNEMQK
jgi:hypothetical protein